MTTKEQMIQVCEVILGHMHPMTVRQVYYQLVAGQVIENRRSQYQRVSKILRDARLSGAIPWDWIEDRLRRPRHVSMWSGLSDFADTCRRSYRLDVWPDQPNYVEVWLEKDALSGIFEDALDGYGVTLNVGRGYDGWDSIHNAAVRFREKDVKVFILYFGDFDPSGEDMVRSLKERLGELEAFPSLVKCALTMDDIKRYDLPPDFTKSTDSRAAAFVAEHGDIAVELDALPAVVLRDRLVEEVETHMDMKALARTKRREKRECVKLTQIIRGLDD